MNKLDQNWRFRIIAIAAAAACFAACTPAVDQRTVENNSIWIEILPDASVRILDKRSGMDWTLGAPRIVNANGDSLVVDAAPAVSNNRGVLSYQAADGTKFQLRAPDGSPVVEYSFEAGPGASEVLLLDEALPVGVGNDNYYAVPKGLGVLMRAHGEDSWTQRLAPYQEDGYSMAMCGVVRNGSAALVTFEAPDAELLVRQKPAEDPVTAADVSVLNLGLAFRSKIGMVRVELLGKSSYPEIAARYRSLLSPAGGQKTLAEKWRETPAWSAQAGAPLFAAASPDECGTIAKWARQEFGFESSFIALGGAAVEPSAIEACDSAAAQSGWRAVAALDTARDAGDLLTGYPGCDERAFPETVLALGLLSQKTGNHPPAEVELVMPLLEMVYGDTMVLATRAEDPVAWWEAEKILDHLLYAAMPIYQSAPGAPPEVSRATGRALFARGGGSSQERFIRNTFEVLSPLNQLAAALPLTHHQFLTPTGDVEMTRFGEDIEIVVNYGESEFATSDGVMPQYGFVVRSPTLLAFCAVSFHDVSYQQPTFFVLRSLDGEPLESSGRVRIYRGFGENRVRYGGEILEVEAERIVSIPR